VWLEIVGVQYGCRCGGGDGCGEVCWCGTGGGCVGLIMVWAEWNCEWNCEWIWVEMEV